MPLYTKIDVFRAEYCTPKFKLVSVETNKQVWGLLVLEKSFFEVFEWAPIVPPFHIFR